MALFSPSSPAANGVSNQRRKAEPQGLSIIAPDLVIKGDLETSGVVKIEGRILGSVHAGHQVLVAQGAEIEGDINTREAVIGGTVKGGIHAAERIEVQSTAVVDGDIATRNLLIQEGGRVNGVVTMRMDPVNSPPPLTHSELVG